MSRLASSKPPRVRNMFFSYGSKKRQAEREQVVTVTNQKLVTPFYELHLAGGVLL